MAAPIKPHEYTQDIRKPVLPRQGGGLMFTGDANADTIIVRLYDGNDEYPVSGSVTMRCIRADGVTEGVDGSVSGNTVQATLKQACCAVPGPLMVTLSVTADGVTSTILKVVYTVDATETGVIGDPGTIIPDVAALIAAIENALGSIPPEYDDLVTAVNQHRHDQYLNGDALRTGRVYQTLTPAYFSALYAANSVIDTVSGDADHAEITPNTSWDVYQFDFGQRMLIRLDAVDKNSGITGVLPAAAKLTVDDVTTYYTLDINSLGKYLLADAILINVSPTLGATIDGISITASVNRDFEDLITCADHANEFDNIVIFGDSIFANYINSSAVGNGVMAQFTSMMGLPYVNNAVGGATLSTIQSSPKNVVQQVRDYKIAAGAPTGTPLYMIDGGTNDQYNNGDGLTNIGAYTDGVGGITNTIYGATYAIINELLGFGAQPWQIVICTPIPKGTRGGAADVAAMDAQLTAIGAAMHEVGAVQRVNVINGYHTPFDNLDNAFAKANLMTDDTHPSELGAALYAERLFRLLGMANARTVKRAEQVLAADLDDIRNTNVLYQNERIIVTGTTGYVHHYIHITEGLEQGIVTLTVGSIVDANNNYVSLTANNDGTQVATTYRNSGTSNISMSLDLSSATFDELVIDLYPAAGSTLPSSGAVYSNILLVNGTAKSISLKNSVDIPNLAARIDDSNVLMTNEDLAKVIGYAADGAGTFVNMGTFAVGGFNADGDLYPQQIARVSSTSIIHIADDTTVRVKDGFRFGYLPFTGGTHGTWSGWKTGSYVIPGNTDLKLSISKDPEGTARADVYEYVLALSIDTATKKQILQNTTNIAALSSELDADTADLSHKIEKDNKPFFSDNIMYYEPLITVKGSGYVHYTVDFYNIDVSKKYSLAVGKMEDQVIKNVSINAFNGTTKLHEVYSNNKTENILLTINLADYPTTDHVQIDLFPCSGTSSLPASGAKYTNVYVVEGEAVEKALLNDVDIPDMGARVENSGVLLSDRAIVGIGASVLAHKTSVKGYPAAGENKQFTNNSIFTAQQAFGPGDMLLVRGTVTATVHPEYFDDVGLRIVYADSSHVTKKDSYITSGQFGNAGYIVRCVRDDTAYIDLCIVTTSNNSYQSGYLEEFIINLDIIKNYKGAANAEYDDIRYTYDGAEMSAAGEAVREQIRSIRHMHIIPFMGNMTPRYMRMYVHRGYANHAPENSIPAFKLAGQAHVWGIETDVQNTSDGHLVLMHNDTIDAMTDGTGEVNSLTYEYIRSCHIDAGANVGEYSPSELIVPTLDEYLEICKYYGCVACIEIKRLSDWSYIEDIVASIYKYGMQDTCILSHNSWGVVQKVAALTKVIPVMRFTNSFSADDITEGRKYENAIVGIINTENITKEIVQTLNSNGIMCAAGVLLTENGIEEMREMGVDMACYEEPAET